MTQKSRDRSSGQPIKWIKWIKWIKYLHFRQGDTKRDQGSSNRAPPSNSRLCEDLCMIDTQQVPNTVKFSIDSSLWWSGSRVIQDSLNGSLEEQHGYKIALWFEISRINWTERNQRWRKGWECGPMILHGPHRWIMLDSSIGLIQVIGRIQLDCCWLLHWVDPILSDDRSDHIQYRSREDCGGVCTSRGWKMERMVWFVSGHIAIVIVSSREYQVWS